MPPYSPASHWVRSGFGADCGVLSPAKRHPQPSRHRHEALQQLRKNMSKPNLTSTRRHESARSRKGSSTFWATRSDGCSQREPGQAFRKTTCSGYGHRRPQARHRILPQTAEESYHRGRFHTGWVKLRFGAHPSRFRFSSSNRHEATIPACRFRAIRNGREVFRPS